MNVIYQPGGAAREYASHAANFYKGCAHGCKYCYAPKATYNSPEQFHDTKWVTARDVLGRFALDCGKFWNDKDRAVDDEVLLSFSCDPYQPIDDKLRYTRVALIMLAHYAIPATVLTKAGMKAARDFDVMKENHAGTEFGTSLVWMDDAMRKEWEPHAATVGKRIDAITKAKQAGLRTWVSLEPVIEPAEALAVIDACHAFVDHWKVGKLNHHPEIEKQVDWADFCGKLHDTRIDLGLDMYIKESLEGSMAEMFAKRTGR